MPERNEQTTTANVATFAGSAFKRRRKKKKKRKTPLAFTKTGISTPVGYEAAVQKAVLDFMVRDLKERKK